MKQKLLLIIILVSQSFVYAQAQKASKILSCWQFNKIEFLFPVEDSANMIERYSPMVSCYFENGKLTVKMVRNSEVIGTHDIKYKISADEKFIFNQQTESDNGYDTMFEILTLDDKQLILKSDSLIFYFVKLKE